MLITFRRGLEADRLDYTPDEAEGIYTTDTKRFYIGDGVTPGGNLVSGDAPVWGAITGTLSDQTDLDNALDGKFSLSALANNEDIATIQGGFAAGISRADLAADPAFYSVYQSLSEKGFANGYASLDSGGKVPAAELPVNVMQYKGVWNANTNTPTLANGTGDSGDVYIVTVAGSTDFGAGSISFDVGDWVIYNGSIWQKVDNTDAVSTVFGRTGAVVSANGDYTASQVTNVAAGNIAATNVQSALNELDTEKQPIDSDLTAIAAISPSNDDIIQRKSGVWVARSMAQVKADLVLSKSDVGLNNVTNDAQLAIANNLSEINTTDNRGSARYNLRTPMLFNAVCVYTSNVASLSGAASATDGVTPANGDVVLLVAQTTPSQNGPWTVNTGGAWTRPTDFPSTGVIRSRLIQIASGTSFANSFWGLAAATSITIDTTAQTWNLIASPAGVFSPLRPTSGDWYSLGGQSAASAPGLTAAGKLVAHPIWLGTGTIDRIGVSSSVAAVSTWRLGLYKGDPSNDMCDAQVPFLDAGTVDMNNTAGLQAVTISQAITIPGWYWAAILVDAYTAQPTTHNVVYSSNSGIGVPGLPQDMSSFGRYRVGRTHGSVVPTGSLPTFPTASITWLGLMPRISVRYA